jgi:hypothetical protein
LSDLVKIRKPQVAGSIPVAGSRQSLLVPRALYRFFELSPRRDTLIGPCLFLECTSCEPAAHRAEPLSIAAAGETPQFEFLFQSKFWLNMKTSPAPLLVSRSLATSLLRLYDYSDPRKPGRIIRGYDCTHALRTARMCAATALHLGHSPSLVRQYQIACLLHDLGRAGLDRRLFGKIWSWAKQQGIPTRPREWRAAHPKTRHGRETEAFLARHGKELVKAGVPLDAWAREQVEMRLGYARRLARQVRAVKPKLARLGVQWKPWMGRVMLYYYYPEKLRGAARWVRQLAEILVACEQFEAYNNRQRGRDYYTRNKEQLREAFAYLGKLQKERILSKRVVAAIEDLVAAGAFSPLMAEARGRALTRQDQAYVRKLGREPACR